MPDLFDVIADPTRRELLRALLDAAAAEPLSGDRTVGELGVGELVARLSLSQPTVSKHLKILRDLSIVTVREQGQHRYYRLDAARLEPIAEWLGAFVSPTPPVSAIVAAPEPVAAVAAHAPDRPLPIPVRTAAIRVGALAASVVHLVARARR